MKIWHEILLFGIIILGTGCSLAADVAAPWPITVTKAWAVALPGMEGFTVSADGRRLLVDIHPMNGHYAVVALDAQGKELWRHTAATGKIYSGGMATDGSRGASTEYHVDEQQKQVRTKVAVFSMTDGKEQASKTYTFPYNGEMDDLFVPVATISPNGKLLLCTEPLYRFMEVYDIQADHLQLRWDVDKVTPQLPKDDEWETITWLPDSNGIVLSTRRGQYYHVIAIHHGTRDGWGYGINGADGRHSRRLGKHRTASMEGQPGQRPA
jgi:hypothetical protein